VASHRLYTDVFMPAAAGATSWTESGERVRLTAILINGQQPSGY
jgi:hypothetical protein